MACDQFDLSATPHVASIAVTHGGSGYTWARARTDGGGGSGVRFKVILTGGSVSEIQVLCPGFNFTSIPDIIIEGDGTGAAATATLSGGSETFENTTTMQDWKRSDCDDYRCAYDDSDPPELLDPEERPETCLIPLEPTPTCGAGMSPPCDCAEPVRLTNTYAAKSPREFTSNSPCVPRRGFKNAFARKEWWGRYGFVDSVAPSQSKFLDFDVTFNFNATNQTYYNGVQDVDDVFDVSDAYISKQTNRYTGVQTDDREFVQTYNGDPVTTGTYYQANAAIFLTDGFDSKAKFTGTEGLDPEWFGLTDLTAAEIITLIGTWNISDSGSTGESDYSYSTIYSDVDVSITNTKITIKFKWTQIDTSDYFSDPTYGVGEPSYKATGNGSFELVIELTNEYTPADVISDCQALLATIDLCDDAKYPWRTDLPIYNASPGYFTKQSGPSFGPLASYGSDSEAMLGAFNPAGYEPFWDSMHANETYTFGDPGGWRWETDSYGAHSPFGTSTQWMPDKSGGLFLAGSHAGFNSAPRQYQVAGGGSLVLDFFAYYESKWAEIYLWEFPHENKARPCGAVDRATLDPDTIDCDEESETYSLTGLPRWTDAEAPCYCNNPTQTNDDPPAACEANTDPAAVNAENTFKKLGSYSVVKWGYEDNVLEDFSCTPANMTPAPCSNNAIFIQREALTGKYVDAVKIAPPSITFFDERLDVGDVPRGSWGLVQIRQAMPDPLWKRPADCIEGTRVPRADATPPYVENTECEDEICVEADCVPSEQTPWGWSAEAFDGEIPIEDL